MTAMQDAVTHLRTIFTGVPEPLKNFVAYKRIENDGRNAAAVCHVDPDSLTKLARLLTEESENSPESNFFVRITPIAEPPQKEGSHGLNEDAIGSGVVWCDVDTLRAGVQKDVALRAIIDCLPGYPPNLVIDTGGGLHGYWRLETWCDDLTAVRGACAAIADRLRVVGGDPAVKDSARVLRLAGTYNRKPMRENALVQIVHQNETTRLPIESAPVLPVSKGTTTSLSIPVIELPADYLPRLRALGRRGKMLADRIENTETAIRAGAALNEQGGIERSGNDNYVACEIWRIGRDALRTDEEIAGEILAVFSNSSWIAGEKGDERADYWERTILNTSNATTRAPDTMYDEKGRVLVDKMAEWLADESGIAFIGVRENAIAYLYDHLTGVYKEDRTDWLLDHIRVSLETRRGSTVSTRESIYKSLRTRQDVPHREAPLDDPGPLIVVRNGILNVETGELRDHSPAHVGFRHLPTDFRKKEDIPAYAFEKVDAFVEQVIPDPDDRRVWWQYVGYCLHRGYFTRGIFYLVGPHGAGKSALLELLSNCFGEENFSHVTPQQMSSDFGLAPLLNALANVSAEAGVSHSMKTIETMKALSGGDAVSINRKNKDQVERKLHVPLLFSANDTPRFTGGSGTEALRSRLLVVSSGPTLPNGSVVPDYGVRLSHDPAVRSAFLSRALDGLQALLTSGTFTRTEAMETKTRAIVEASDEVRQFMRDLDWVRATGNAEDAVEKDQLYQHYLYWLSLHDPHARVDSQAVFQARIRSLIIEGIIPAVEDRDERQNSRGRNLWTGLQIEEHGRPGSEGAVRGSNGFSGFSIKR